jgi:uncharacterized protein (TIGR02246 family)
MHRPPTLVARLGACLLAVATGACSSTGGEPGGQAVHVGRAAGRAEDEAAVRGLLALAAEHFGAHDADGYLALHAADAALVNVNGRLWRLPDDRGQVRDAYRTALREARMDLEDVELTWLRPDVVLARCDLTVGPFLDAGGGRRPAERQRALFVISREAGRWVVRAFQNTRVAHSPGP